jgi:nicotinamide mononucleotide transporter
MLFLSDAIPWLQKNIIEIIAVITGLLYIFYTIREKNLLWLFGIISSALYVGIFFKSQIYAYALLYVYYVIIGFYGWYNWGKQGTESTLKIRKTPFRYLLRFIVATVILVIPIYFVLDKFTDSDMALADAVLSSGGIVATWMLTQKYLEQWILWIVIDLISCGAMIYKQLYPSAFLFLFYALLALIGYLKWKKEIRQ